MCLVLSWKIGFWRKIQGWFISLIMFSLLIELLNVVYINWYLVAQLTIVIISTALGIFWEMLTLQFMVYQVMVLHVVRFSYKIFEFEWIKLAQIPKFTFGVFLFFLLFIIVFFPSISSRSLRNIKYMGTPCCDNMDLGQLCETLWRWEQTNRTCYLISKPLTCKISIIQWKFVYSIVYVEKEENKWAYEWIRLFELYNRGTRITIMYN